MGCGRTRKKKVRYALTINEAQAFIKKQKKRRGRWIDLSDVLL